MAYPTRPQGEEVIFFPYSNTFFDLQGGREGGATDRFLYRARYVKDGGGTPNSHLPVFSPDVDVVYNNYSALPSDVNGMGVAVVSPDSARVYVGDYRGTRIQVVDAGSNALVATYTLPRTGTRALAVAPDGLNVYATVYEANTPGSVVYRVSTTSGEVSGQTGNINVPPLNAAFKDIAFARDGSKFYTSQYAVPQSTPPIISEYSASSLARGRTISLAGRAVPYGLTVSRDGTRLYVAAVSGSQPLTTLYEIDASSFSITRSLDIPQVATGLAINFDESKIALGFSLVDMDSFTTDWIRSPLPGNGLVYFAWVEARWDAVWANVEGGSTNVYDQPAGTSSAGLQTIIYGPNNAARRGGIIPGAINPSVWRDEANRIYIAATERSTGLAGLWKSEDDGRTYARVAA